MSEPMTVQEALTRLRQYQERPAPTWSTASYGSSAAESTLAEIGRTLAAELHRMTDEAGKVTRKGEITQTEFPPLFIADYEGAELTLHLTPEAARAACDDYAKAEAHGRYWDWRTEDGIERQFWTRDLDDAPTGYTGGAVWQIEVEREGEVTQPCTVKENYPSELAMLRGFLEVIRAVASHGDMAEVRRIVAEYDTDESAAYAEMKEKGEPAPAADTAPLVIFWDRFVMGPSGDTDDENTLVPCRTEDGRPAALVLDDEHRQNLGEQLLTPLGDDARALLAEIRRRGGAITSGQAHRWLRTHSSASTPRAYARTLLRRLAEYGDLVVREEQGRRVFALNHAGGEGR